MIPGTVLTLMPLVLGVFAANSGVIGQSISRMTVHQEEVIVRVPIQPRTVLNIEWVERKGPKCVPAEMIRRAVLSGDEQIDFVLSNRTRIRAKLDEDCPALDFYGGFYLQMEDERLCADRDEIHSREGGSCRIHRFKQLTPKLP